MKNSCWTRIMTAQAITEKMIMISNDKNFHITKIKGLT